MRRLLSVLALVAIAGVGLSGEQGSAPTRTRTPNPESLIRVRIAYLYSDGNMTGTLKAFRALLQEGVRIAQRRADSHSNCRLNVG